MLTFPCKTSVAQEWMEITICFAERHPIFCVRGSQSKSRKSPSEAATIRKLSSSDSDFVPIVVVVVLGSAQPQIQIPAIVSSSNRTHVLSLCQMSAEFT